MQHELFSNPLSHTYAATVLAVPTVAQMISMGKFSIVCASKSIIQFIGLVK